jgi:hypothetical protein
MEQRGMRFDFDFDFHRQHVFATVIQKTQNPTRAAEQIIIKLIFY